MQEPRIPQLNIPAIAFNLTHPHKIPHQKWQQKIFHRLCFINHMFSLAIDNNKFGSEFTTLYFYHSVLR